MQLIGPSVEVDLVGVLLRRVGALVAQQCPQHDDVLLAFAQEAIREAVAKLMRREPSHTCASTYAPEHSHQRLPARRRLRVESTPLSFGRRDPLLNFDREDMVVEIRLNRSAGVRESSDDIRRKRHNLIVVAFASDGDAAAVEVDVASATAEHFRSPQSRTFHEQDRRPFAHVGSGAQCIKLRETGPIDVGPPLGRATKLP